MCKLAKWPRLVFFVVILTLGTVASVHEAQSGVSNAGGTSFAAANAATTQVCFDDSANNTCSSGSHLSHGTANFKTPYCGRVSFGASRPDPTAANGIINLFKFDTSVSADNTPSFCLYQGSELSYWSIERTDATNIKSCAGTDFFDGTAHCSTAAGGGESGNLDNQTGLSMLGINQTANAMTYA